MKKMDDNLISLYSSSDIKNRVEELGLEISEDFEKKEPIFIGVLKTFPFKSIRFLWLTS